MISYLKRHREGLLVGWLGFIIFASLNVLMLQNNPKLWTNPKVGFWSAFQKGFEFSGFDQHTYIIISSWRPLYTHLRHPLLAAFMWPFSELNNWLMNEWHMNFAIFIVAIVWTLVSTMAWLLLYRILRRLVSLAVAESLLLCLMFFGFAYVMLATFVPDHMLLTMTTLLLTLYLAGKARKEGGTLAIWKALLLYFVGMGITTTNSIKIWLIDMFGAAMPERRRWRRLFVRSLAYLIPTLIMAGLYIYQEETVIAEEHRNAERQVRQHMMKDSVFRKKELARVALHSKANSNQIADGQLFQYTNTDISRLRSLSDNIFGEGLQLHEDHLLKDANLDKRPIFVSYRHWINDAVEGLIVLLFLAGLWCGRHRWFMWMALLPFLFDMLLHVGLSFALSDIYIMTAHWAYVIPVAMAYLVIEARKKRWQYYSVIAVMGMLALWLWWHNAHLIVQHILKISIL